jgi:hypothetical protein
VQGPDHWTPWLAIGLQKKSWLCGSIYLTRSVGRVGVVGGVGRHEQLRSVIPVYSMWVGREREGKERTRDGRVKTYADVREY